MTTRFLLVLLLACGGNQSSTETETPETETEEREVEPTSACSAHRDCGSCLGANGCNWTGGMCADECLMDTSCYGPGNPAAASCPAATTAIVGSWQEDMAQRQGDVRVFVDGAGDLGPARFRQQWSFAEGGVLSTNVLAPDDAHYSVEGSWSIADGQLKLSYAQRDGTAVEQSFEIVELDGDVLRVRLIQ